MLSRMVLYCRLKLNYANNYLNGGILPNLEILSGWNIISFELH